MAAQEPGPRHVLPAQYSLESQSRFEAHAAGLLDRGGVAHKPGVDVEKQCPDARQQISPVAQVSPAQTTTMLTPSAAASGDAIEPQPAIKATSAHWAHSEARILPRDDIRRVYRSQLNSIRAWNGE